VLKNRRANRDGRGGGQEESRGAGHITAPGGDGRWLEMLRRWVVECPRCAEVWLVVGAREMDGHVCKGCGHGFRITPPQAEVNAGR
jgi:hypothetical protein